MLTDALARDQNNALVTDAFRPQSGDSFAHVSRITMAERMQIGTTFVRCFEITRLSKSAR